MFTGWTIMQLKTEYNNNQMEFESFCFLPAGVIFFLCSFEHYVPRISNPCICFLAVWHNTYLCFNLNSNLIKKSSPSFQVWSATPTTQRSNSTAQNNVRIKIFNHMTSTNWMNEAQINFGVEVEQQKLSSQCWRWLAALVSRVNMDIVWACT